MACFERRQRAPSAQLFSSWQRRQASARATGSPVLKLKIKPRLPTVGLQVAAGRPVAAFARIVAMHVLGKRLGIRLVASRTQLVIVDVFGARHCRYCALDFLIGNLGEERVAAGPTGIEIRFGTARRLSVATGRRPPRSATDITPRTAKAGNPNAVCPVFSCAHSYTSV